MISKGRNAYEEKSDNSNADLGFSENTSDRMSWQFCRGLKGRQTFPARGNERRIPSCRGLVRAPSCIVTSDSLWQKLTRLQSRIIKNKNHRAAHNVLVKTIGPRINQIPETLIFTIKNEAKIGQFAGRP